MTTISVRTGAPYEVRIERGLLREAGPLCASLLSGRRAALVTDENVARHWLAPVRASLEAAGFAVTPAVLAPGERTKSPEVLVGLLERFAEVRLSRADVVVALGGGVIGDLAGLAAALYMRGVACVEAPTSLLAMIDSSVGGKTAVNLRAGKNLMGVFKQPKLVICDPAALSTLPREEWANGMGEAVKYGAIAGGELPQLLGSLSPCGEASASLDRLIARSVEIKRDVVEADEREGGLREVLNFGHTPAHAIELLSGYRAAHGAAVAAGMAMMVRGASAAGECEPHMLAELLALLERWGLPDRTNAPVDAMIEAAKRDKKARGEGVTVIWPLGWGRVERRRLDWAALAALWQSAKREERKMPGRTLEALGDAER